jgi:ABC-type antimicrobial peptide transport system permease subunit
MGVAGVVLGLGGAMVGRMFLVRFLFGATTSDSFTLLAAAILLLLVIAVASAIPARRAIRIDPVQALRNQ